jgi:hypothetical protein
VSEVGEDIKVNVWRHKMNQADSEKLIQYILENREQFPELEHAIESFIVSNDALMNFVREGLDMEKLHPKLDNIFRQLNDTSLLESAGLVEYARAVFYFSILVQSIPKDKKIILLSRDIDKEGEKLV